jgi:ABC-2 type transport system ATP-binding protein
MAMAPSPEVVVHRTWLAGPCVVEVRDLTRRFGTFVAVDRVNFSVQRAQAFGLIGSNGAGKSTIIWMLTTLLPVTSGSGTVAGYDLVRQAGQVRGHIGCVLQLQSVAGALTACENLLLSARLYGIPHREVRSRIEQALASMELLPVAHHLVQGFSSGMVRRLEIAQSRLHRRAVLFMEQPTLGLDPVARRAVLDHVVELRHEFGTTILVSSHYMEEIQAVCDRLGLLSHGRLVDVGTPAELKARVGPEVTLDGVFAALVQRFHGTTLIVLAR